MNNSWDLVQWLVTMVSDISPFPYGEGTKQQASPNGTGKPTLTKPYHSALNGEEDDLQPIILTAFRPTLAINRRGR